MKLIILLLLMTLLISCDEEQKLPESIKINAIKLSDKIYLVKVTGDTVRRLDSRHIKRTDYSRCSIVKKKQICLENVTYRSVYSQISRDKGIVTDTDGAISQIKISDGVFIVSVLGSGFYMMRVSYDIKGDALDYKYTKVELDDFLY